MERQFPRSFGRIANWYTSKLGEITAFSQCSFLAPSVNGKLIQIYSPTIQQTWISNKADPKQEVYYKRSEI